MFSISTHKGDAFARTFIAKADMQGQWDDCIGVFDDTGDLMAAIITTVSKRKPWVANLQLLHTFVSHRGNGAGKFLCEFSLRRAIGLGAKYFRVSSEATAVQFYEKIGFRFWGKQKSGCQLSIFKIGGNTFDEGIYDYSDPVIYKAIHKRGKGGCVDLFHLAKSQENNSLESFRG